MNLLAFVDHAIVASRASWLAFAQCVYRSQNTQGYGYEQQRNEKQCEKRIHLFLFDPMLLVPATLDTYRDPINTSTLYYGNALSESGLVASTGTDFMKKKTKKTQSGLPSERFEGNSVPSDFYSANPAERPLNEDRGSAYGNHVRKTGRHQTAQGRRKETADPREKMALLAILKTGVVAILLAIAFLLLWKGIAIYEENLFQKQQGLGENAPVLREVVQVEDIDFAGRDSHELFSERIDVWKETERLIRSADSLLLRDNVDLAIERCQEAVRLNPAHVGALERLGNLYARKELHAEAIEAYIQLLNVHPDRKEYKENLIALLDDHGDSDAVVFMAQWYLDQNTYNASVQRHLAHAYYVNEDFAAAADAYKRVLKDNPDDTEAMEQLVNAQMLLKEYDNALPVLENLRVWNYRDQRYYRLIAVCQAQLGQSHEVVQTLGKAAHLFGQNVVIGWIQDPMLDPVRQDRTFQAFAGRVGGEEFRKWLEQVAATMEKKDEKEITPQILVPEREGIDSSLLQRNQQ